MYLSEIINTVVIVSVLMIEMCFDLDGNSKYLNNVIDFMKTIKVKEKRMICLP
jgi:hypothetical protein